MKPKTIEKVIKVKMEEWLSSITDSELRKEVRDNLLVSGGSITSMFLNEPVNDYDVYLMNMDLCKRIAQYYISKNPDIELFDGREKQLMINDFNSSAYNLDLKDDQKPIDINSAYTISLRNLKPDQIKLYFKTKTGGLKANEGVDISTLNYAPLYYSPNAISLSNNIQIVLRFWGTAEQVHKTFDFIHATNYFTFKDGLVINLKAIEAILTKQLLYQGSLYPVTSIIRAKKFIKRGFNIGAGELLKIMFQISSLDLSNPDVLEEQLIGVDVAYFALLIEALRNKFESEKDFKLSHEYFNALVDKIFNESEETSHD